MNELEIEVKFYVELPARMQDQILALGAEGRPEVFEHNIRFEDAADSLTARGCLLRLRRDDRSWLTFKSPPPKDQREPGQFKVMEELEVSVSDFETTHRILEALGFRPDRIYQKKRRTFLLAGCHLCLVTVGIESTN